MCHSGVILVPCASAPHPGTCHLPHPRPHTIPHTATATATSALMCPHHCHLHPHHTLWPSRMLPPLHGLTPTVALMLPLVCAGESFLSYYIVTIIVTIVTAMYNRHIQYKKQNKKQETKTSVWWNEKVMVKKQNTCMGFWATRSVAKTRICKVQVLDLYLYGCGFCRYRCRLDHADPCHTHVPPYLLLSNQDITVPLEPFIVTGTIMRALIMSMVPLSIRRQTVIGLRCRLAGANVIFCLFNKQRKSPWVSETIFGRLWC